MSIAVYSILMAIITISGLFWSWAQCEQVACRTIFFGTLIGIPLTIYAMKLLSLDVHTNYQVTTVITGLFVGGVRLVQSISNRKSLKKYY
ncbi:hypothetical protein [Ewingella americana]|uniref:hypothetical protein n=1 Tax=Ewingella americana TaxID=41202 RepID=UPI00163A4539|nr:hypothetical protein [Ewingella americana]QMV54205.1 hypothetical protein GXP68_23320 [Ewingella americana]